MTIRTKMVTLVRSIGQSALSLSFNLGGLLAGTLLATYFDVFSITSWSLLIYPGILSARGAVGGLFCGRLSTALHLGTIRPSFTRNTKDFYLLLYAVITLTVGSSVMMGLVASLFSVFLGITAVDSLDLLVVIIATMGLSLVFIPPITLGISVLSFKKNLDPDVIVYPVISTVADILVTVCYIFVLDIFFSSKLGRYWIGLFDLVFLLIVGYILTKNYREKEFVKTLKEFFLTLVLTAFIVNITGSFLSKVHQIIGDRPEIYVVYPALIDTVGDVGSIVGSTATTKLALGIIGSSFSSIKQHLVEIGGAWSASLIMFTLYALIASSMYGLTASSDVLSFTVRLLTTNLLAVLLIVAVSFALAISTHRRGWDPDNFVIPIESSLADTITTISLLIALTIAV